MPDSFPKPIKNKGEYQTLNFISIFDDIFQKLELVKYCMNKETGTVGGSDTSGSEFDGAGVIDPRQGTIFC